MHFGMGEDFYASSCESETPKAGKLKVRKSKGILGVPSNNITRRKSKIELELSQTRAVSKELLKK